MNTLVTTEWLNDHLNDPDLVILDCNVITLPDELFGYKNVSGRSEYAKSHIPGAGFADLTVDLSDMESPLDFDLPSPEEFCTVMGALGVGDDSRVVLYDEWMGWAARVWWMLKWVGFDNAALLNGGSKAWVAEGRPVSKDVVSRPTKVLSPRVRPEIIADRDEVLAAMKSDSVTLIDTMPADHYCGDETMYGRPGHIPTAVNVSVLDLYDESGRFRAQEELAELFNFDRASRYITYCGGGISASAAAFVMTRLGFTDVAVYTASLQEWAADVELPLEVGAG